MTHFVALDTQPVYEWINETRKSMKLYLQYTCNKSATLNVTRMEKNIKNKLKL